MTAWYLKVDSSPQRAVLVGDRGRVLRAAGMLDDAELLSEDRGLTSVVGSWNNTPVMVAAFGMGAPIAAIVMHELAALGTTVFVRAGTMMTPAVPLGHFIIGERAYIHEGTSGTYGVTGEVIDLEPGMARTLERACNGAPTVTGPVATCDGFYTQMTDLLNGPATDLQRQWAARDVVGIDMETSALASVASALDVTFGCLCLATVAVDGPRMLEGARREPAEHALMEHAFDAITTWPTDERQP